MFLALTALDSLWNKKDEIKFLGRWCIKNSSNIQNLSYSIMDYHWDDQMVVEKDNEYIFSLYKKMMPILSKKLN